MPLHMRITAFSVTVCLHDSCESVAAICSCAAGARQTLHMTCLCSQNRRHSLQALGQCRGARGPTVLAPAPNGGIHGSAAYPNSAQGFVAPGTAPAAHPAEHPVLALRADPPHGCQHVPAHALCTEYEHGVTKTDKRDEGSGLLGHGQDQGLSFLPAKLLADIGVLVVQACWQTSRYQDCLQHGAPRACRTTNSSPKTLTLNPKLNACSVTHPRHVAALAAAVPRGLEDALAGRRIPAQPEGQPKAQEGVVRHLRACKYLT